MKFSRIYFLLILSICFSCAKQTTPTGGPKDTIPPILLKVIPGNNTINFKGKNIELTFDEMVITNNPKEQLIVTPNIGKEFEMNAKKNKVVLTLKENLKDSTTYSFNFGNSIQDLTEKNPAENVQLAISSGPWIDSLSLEGNVYDLLKGKEVKNAMVAIYHNKDTFNIFKHKPSYLTKTSEKGNFIISNLEAGVYYIYAFEDKNKNLTVDSKTESYGYLADSLNLTSDIKDISIPILRLDARPLKLTGARPYKNYLNLRTSKNLVNYSIKTKKDSIPLISFFGEDQSSIKIYNTIEYTDSLEINFMGLDSIGNALDTTLFIKYNPENKKLEPEKFGVSILDSRLLTDKTDLTINLSYIKPISSINFDSIFFKIDSANAIPILKEDLVINRMSKKISIHKKLDKSLFPKEVPKTNGSKEESGKTKHRTLKNQLYIAKASFISVDNDSSKKIDENVKPVKTEELGQIEAEIKTKEKNFFVQLLDKDFKIIETTYNMNKIKFEDLKPAEYMLRLIIDTNRNNTWDPGNYFKNQNPEKMIFYKNEKGLQTIYLKANWEVGDLLITY